MGTGWNMQCWQSSALNSTHFRKFAHSEKQPRIWTSHSKQLWQEQQLFFYSIQFRKKQPAHTQSGNISASPTFDHSRVPWWRLRLLIANLTKRVTNWNWQPFWTCSSSFVALCVSIFSLCECSQFPNSSREQHEISLSINLSPCGASKSRNCHLKNHRDGSASLCHLL